MALADRTNIRYGRLFVVGPGPRQGEARASRFTWRCICDCGNKVILRSDSLSAGTISCGCYQKERIAASVRKHGKSRKGNSEYITWQNIKGRCYNENRACYHNYGGKGIKVCERWLNSFENFLLDMGPKPSKKHSIERRKNDQDYTRENCYWATRFQQNRNHSRNCFIEFDGRKMVLQDWASELRVGSSGIAYHLKRGKAFSEIYEYYKLSVFERNQFNINRIYCSTWDSIFESSKILSKLIGSNEDDIHEVCRGLKSQIKGLSFRYLIK